MRPGRRAPPGWRLPGGSIFRARTRPSRRLPGLDGPARQRVLDRRVREADTVSGPGEQEVQEAPSGVRVGGAACAAHALYDEHAVGPEAEGGQQARRGSLRPRFGIELAVLDLDDAAVGEGAIALGCLAVSELGLYAYESSDVKGPVGRSQSPVGDRPRRLLPPTLARAARPRGAGAVPAIHAGDAGPAPPPSPPGDPRQRRREIPSSPPRGGRSASPPTIYRQRVLLSARGPRSRRRLPERLFPTPSSCPSSRPADGDAAAMRHLRHVGGDHRASGRLWSRLLEARRICPPSNV